MKQRPETLFTSQIPQVCLLYGNNPSIEEYLVLNLVPERLNASGADVKTFTESELLAISKEKLYLETSLFQSPKLYVVRDVTDKFLSLLQSYEPMVPLVLTGKNLKSSSKVVTYLVNHPKYQTIPIYGDDAQFLSTFANYQLRNYRLEPGVVGAILSHIQTFKLLRQQLALLRQLYPEGSTLTVSEIEATLIPAQQIEIFKVAEVTVSKNPKAMIDVFQKAGPIFQKEMIPLLRIVAKQFWDLVGLRRHIDQGQSAQQVVGQAQPTIPFNRRPQVIHNLSKWTVKGLLNALIMIDEMEMIAKQPQTFSNEIMERLFLQMTKL